MSLIQVTSDGPWHFLSDIPLSLIVSGSIHLVANGSTSSFLRAEERCVEWHILNLKALIHKDTCSLTSAAALFPVATAWKRPLASSAWECPLVLCPEQGAEDLGVGAAWRSEGMRQTRDPRGGAGLAMGLCPHGLPVLEKNSPELSAYLMKCFPSSQQPSPCSVLVRSSDCCRR